MSEAAGEAAPAASTPAYSRRYTRYVLGVLVVVYPGPDFCHTRIEINSCDKVRISHMSRFIFRKKIGQAYFAGILRLMLYRKVQIAVGLTNRNSAATTTGQLRNQMRKLDVISFIQRHQPPETSRPGNTFRQ